MTNPDIAHYMHEGIKWMSIGAGSFVGYLVGLCGMQIWKCSLKSNEKITSQEHLERIVKEEAEKLGMNSSLIKPKYDSNRCASRKNFDGRYDLHLNCDFLRKRSVVKHELYHIYKGDCDRGKKNFFINFFIDEPRATMYEVFGWKL